MAIGLPDCSERASKPRQPSTEPSGTSPSPSGTTSPSPNASLAGKEASFTNPWQTSSDQPSQQHAWVHGSAPSTTNPFAPSPFNQQARTLGPTGQQLPSGSSYWGEHVVSPSSNQAFAGHGSGRAPGPLREPRVLAPINFASSSTRLLASPYSQSSQGVGQAEQLIKIESGEFPRPSPSPAQRSDSRPELLPREPIQSTWNPSQQTARYPTPLSWQDEALNTPHSTAASLSRRSSAVYSSNYPTPTPSTINRHTLSPVSTTTNSLTIPDPDQILCEMESQGSDISLSFNIIHEVPFRTPATDSETPPFGDQPSQAATSKTAQEVAHVENGVRHDGEIQAVAARQKKSKGKKPAVLENCQFCGKSLGREFFEGPSHTNGELGRSRRKRFDQRVRYARITRIMSNGQRDYAPARDITVVFALNPASEWRDQPENPKPVFERDPNANDGAGNERFYYENGVPIGAERDKTLEPSRPLRHVGWIYLRGYYHRQPQVGDFIALGNVCIPCSAKYGLYRSEDNMKIVSQTREEWFVCDCRIPWLYRLEPKVECPTCGKGAMFSYRGPQYDG